MLIQSQLAIFAGLWGTAAFSPALVIAAISFSITWALPAWFTAIPSSLVAVILTTAGAGLTAAPAPTLAQTFGADLFRGGFASLPSLSVPGLAPAPPFTLDTLKIILPAALSIALISALETLLARKVVAEETGLPLPDAEKDRRDNSKALYALSGANVLSACLGGFGGCGLIPNTLLNLKSGGRTATSGLAYALSIALFTLVVRSPSRCAYGYACYQC